jgi:hypothetical protein
MGSYWKGIGYWGEQVWCMRSYPLPREGGVQPSASSLHTKTVVSCEADVIYLLWNPSCAGYSYINLTPSRVIWEEGKLNGRNDSVRVSCEAFSLVIDVEVPARVGSDISGLVEIGSLRNWAEWKPSKQVSKQHPSMASPASAPAFSILSCLNSCPNFF